MRRLLLSRATLLDIYTLAFVPGLTFFAPHVDLLMRLLLKILFTAARAFTATVVVDFLGQTRSIRLLLFEHRGA